VLTPHSLSFSSYLVCLSLLVTSMITAATPRRSRSSATSIKSAEDPKIVKEQQDILEALKLEKEHGEYKWSQLFKRDEVQTGRCVLLAYGMQVSKDARLYTFPTRLTLRDSRVIDYEPNRR
jgi:hypothetical protein